MVKTSDDEYIPESPDSASSAEPTTKPASSKEAGLPATSTASNNETSAEPATKPNNEAVPSMNSQTPTVPGIPQLRPACDLDKRFTMSGDHEHWQAITTSTSKCDVCRENRRGILYMCRQCSRNVCTQCVQDGNLGDKKHRFDPKNIIWKGPQKKTSKPPVKRQGVRSGRVTKATKNPPPGGNELMLVGKRGQPRSASAFSASQPTEIGSDRPYRMQLLPLAREQQAPSMGANGQPHEGPQAMSNSKGAIASAQLAASALAEMRSGSPSEDDTALTGLGIRQIHSARPPMEHHNRDSMHRPRPLRPDLRATPERPDHFEPHELGRRPGGVEKGCREEVRPRSSTPFETRPPPLSAYDSASDASLRQAQANSQKGMALTESPLYKRSAREASVSPETVVGSPRPQNPGIMHQDEQPSRSQLPSIHDAMSSAPLNSQPAEGRRSPNHVTLPPFRQIIQGVSPTPSSHVVPRPGHQSQRQAQIIQNSHTRQSSLDDESASMAGYYQPPAAPRIPGPVESPLTREPFPPPRTDAEAYGLWQIFKVHESHVQSPKVSTEESLLEHTAKLWDHLLKQPPQVEEKFRLLRNATWYAATRLGLDVGNSESTRWLKELESLLLAKGHRVERSFLESYRG